MIGDRWFYFEFGRLRVEVRFLLVIICLVLSSCVSKPIRSLCIMDFENQMCWTDEPTKEGLTFEQMSIQQLECYVNQTVPCWYSITGSDLTSVVDSL